MVNLHNIRNEPKQFIIQRGVIPLPALDASYMIDKESGYIRINKFSRTTFEEFMMAMEALEKQGMKKLVLDIGEMAEVLWMKQ